MVQAAASATSPILRVRSYHMERLDHLTSQRIREKYMDCANYQHKFEMFEKLATTSEKKVNGYTTMMNISTCDVSWRTVTSR